MKQGKVIYMNPEQAQEIDPSLIDLVTLTTGSVIKVLDQEEAEEFQEENIVSNQPICDNCHHPIDATYNTENVFRGGKKVKKKSLLKQNKLKKIRKF